MSEVQNHALTKSQAACLAALRAGASSAPEIAAEAKVGRFAVVRALRALEAAGLAEQGSPGLWRATARADSAPLVAKARARPGQELSPNARRLLELLDDPTEVRKIFSELGVSRQGALDIVQRLHSRGLVKFCDPSHPTWMVMRAADDRPVLARQEARVLSALPGAYATNPLQIRRRTGLSEENVEGALQRLERAGFVEPAGEFNGGALYRITEAGRAHPQRSPEARDAKPPHLPVYSDRVRAVLAALESAGGSRIRDVRDSLKIPQKSINALMQYLKRKKLVVKAGEWFEDPYVLTPLGRLSLAEMTQRGHMAAGYEKGALDALESPKGHPRRFATEEARVLAAVRSDRPADLPEVCGATQLSQNHVQAALDRLKERALVEVAGERESRPLYRATPAGVSQKRTRKPPAPALPRLPVHSDRIHSVLSVIANAGALRIKQVAETLKLPAQSVNALMQYLKRKALVHKLGEAFDAPYALTETGRVTLAGMEQRRAA